MTTGWNRETVVVGAGVLGCLIARELLAADPAASVTVLDRDMVAGGATRRSAGLHFPRGANPVVRAMAAESQRYYADLVAARPDLPIHRLAMTVVAPEHTEPKLREVYLPESDLRRATELPDGVTLPEGTAAWSGDGCQYADVPALTEALAAELRPRAEFLEGVTVTGVTSDEDGVRLTLGTGVTLTAERVVLAPGPWLADKAWRHLVEPLGARVKKIVALHIERPPALDDGAVVFQEEDAFLLPYRHRGHWLFSYTCAGWDVDPDTVEPGLTPAHCEEAREILGRYVPGLVDRCVSGRVFCDAYAPGGAPLIRPLTDDGRLVFAGAAGGSGYRLAPAVARETVRLLSARPSSRKDTPPSSRKDTTLSSRKDTT
ncbi:NAD(P)/FAD-dependent oxidoreductase [Streptomyces ipomoeae]|uniref:FAD dependent oxidoreductase n=1 Tax=Streptomyces ipomoeae 91-03 TaxID=698759 RepID=L1L0B1_9ACTN|nr:FAD-dependent oxidoreductase [Streptomyces ipomoeae]EKX66302.1 FAD dependent oxidoreductase [Streptomyces ipomoeae 91-03]MDX2696287.1 FAD-dependent oxidoreductase [Streptomyces ipomoeae]MDX2842056.1 FAD-dependent oxidoreductase [Streptomyces ipomoeae]